MSYKNIFFYKLNTIEQATGAILPAERFYPLIENIIRDHSLNNSVDLSYDDESPVVMDIFNVRDPNYLFCRLCQKRPNNTVQRRNYRTLISGPVLTEAEREHNGIEAFTYCLLDKQNAILITATNQGAPGQDAFNRFFVRYNRAYHLECLPIPNVESLRALYDSEHSEINEITFDIPCLNTEYLQRVLNVGDSSIIRTAYEAVADGIQTVSISLKPEPRGSLSDNQTNIHDLINALHPLSDVCTKLLLRGKEDHHTKTQEYDLRNQFFKFTISIRDHQTVDGHLIELPAEEIQQDYYQNMCRVYDENRVYVLNAFDNPQN